MGGSQAKVNWKLETRANHRATSHLGTVVLVFDRRGYGMAQRVACAVRVDSGLEV